MGGGGRGFGGVPCLRISYGTCVAWWFCTFCLFDQVMEGTVERS